MVKELKKKVREQEEDKKKLAEKVADFNRKNRGLRRVNELLFKQGEVQQERINDLKFERASKVLRTPVDTPTRRGSLELESLGNFFPDKPLVTTPGVSSPSSPSSPSYFRRSRKGSRSGSASSSIHTISELPEDFLNLSTINKKLSKKVEKLNGKKSELEGDLKNLREELTM